MAGYDSVKVLVLVCLLLILHNACVCLCSNRSLSSVCFEDERDALLQFKQSLLDTSHLLSSWSGEDCCQWTGVTCDQINGHVVKLQITPGREFFIEPGFNGYPPGYEYPLPQIVSNTSKLNSSLLNLRYLSFLDLSGISFGNANKLKFIGSMQQLRYLNSSHSLASANIPHEWGNLTKLEVLDLRCYFPFCEGLGDDVQWISHLRALKYLDMSGLDTSRAGDLVQYLDLSANLFEGPIPSTIFQNMTSLWHLSLSLNFFNSSVPRWFDNLRSLRDLNLANNLLQSFEGGLFSFLRNKPFLESLLLGQNEFHKEIGLVDGNSSELIGKNLERLEMSYNFLDGALPDWLMHLQKLTVLDLSNNQLHGTIPSSYDWLSLEELGRLRVLGFLDLSNNLLNGTIPHSLGQLQDLQYLDLSTNSLRGTVSEIHFANLLKLRYLDISNNHLALEVDADWIPPFNLSYVGMMSCKVGTEFPRWIRTQIDVEDLLLSNASIKGALPDWLVHMPLFLLNLSHNQINGFDLSHNLTSSLPKFPSGVFSFWDLSHNLISSLPKFPFGVPSLDLSHNQINGSLPKEIPSGMYSLDLSHNLISGPIPQDIGPNLSSLNLNDNLLSGPIPTSLCKMDLDDLHLGRNKLVGEIPTCWKESPWSSLDLSSNKLSGVIPNSLGNLIGLTSLHLNNNSLHGEIPVTLNYCKNLMILDLGENKISGSVPHWIGPGFPLLQILRLRENMFNGSIPSQLCLLSALQILDLAVNNLTGMIPNCLGYIKSMKLSISIDEGNLLSPAYAPMPTPGSPPAFAPTDWTQENVEQVVKGIDLEYTTLDLQLMVNLDLSSNKLSLDLSNNHLSGTIPQSFSAFTSLSKLNLSHNNFMGPIPKGNQIQTLDDPSIYAGNPLLCGDPLQKKCPGAEAPQAPKEGTNEEGKLEKVMFYVVIMLGFATGFWGVVGSLVYKKNWRRAYFNFVDRKVDKVYVIVVVKAAELRRRLRRA
ncbi:hypothetical protein BT93_K2232 [Corymbia citriodora subsp. variegata]|nr:hypothetical protein BT93_K2232 [Corymbia citriodora subsp. variegata]